MNERRPTLLNQTAKRKGSIEQSPNLSEPCSSMPICLNPSGPKQQPQQHTPGIVYQAAPSTIEFPTNSGLINPSAKTKSNLYEPSAAKSSFMFLTHDAIAQATLHYGQQEDA